MRYARNFFVRLWCLAGLAALIMIVDPTPTPAQPAGQQSQTSEAELAGQLLTAITTAQTRFIADFGKRAFDRMDFPGGKSLGDVWAEYLSKAGYPSVAEREPMVKLLPHLDRQAQTVFYMALAREEAVEHLIAGLKRIATGAPQPGAPKSDLSGASFSVIFGDDTSIQSTLTADDRSSYQPRSGDEISWRFACTGGSLPDLKTSLRGCFDNNYGYLIADADKRPLETDQGRYAFAGSRTTGERMVYEAPSGDCRPRFLEMKARACKLEVRVSRRPPQ